jgi:hypothetical protein
VVHLEVAEVVLLEIHMAETLVQVIKVIREELEHQEMVVAEAEEMSMLVTLLGVVMVVDLVEEVVDISSEVTLDIPLVVVVEVLATTQ